jgi:hypothetical protein
MNIDIYKLKEERNVRFIWMYLYIFWDTKEEEEEEGEEGGG